MTESIGAWPEFILKGTFCKRSMEGLCSPCFYSRFPLSKATRAEYLRMVEEQLAYVTDNFQELVINNQYAKNARGVSLVLTPTGSYFDEYEFPIELRLAMEKKLFAFSEQHGIDIYLHIESHCEDIIEYDISRSIAKDEIDCLRKLHTRVIFGFESADEYCRNVIYNKKLRIEDFEAAATKAINYGLAPGAFVFAGLFSLNEAQTMNDVLATVDYMMKQGVFPVIMFQNVQPYTITDVLLKEKKIHMLEPFTVATIIADVLKVTESNNSYWLIADPIGGPPEPACHIFKEPQITDLGSASMIYNAIVTLRRTRDTGAFFDTYEKVKTRDKYEQFIEYIQSLPRNFDSVPINTERLLNYCTQALVKYVDEIGE